MGRILLAMIFIFVLAGCGPNDPNCIMLEPEWAPLRMIVKTSWGETGAYYTASPVIYTKHTSDFLSCDKLHKIAILSHERLHAQHQESIGLQTFQNRYSFEIGFRRQEELEATAIQIQVLVAGGETPSPYEFGEFMATHYDGAFDYDSTVAWVANLISKSKGE